MSWRFIRWVEAENGAGLDIEVDVYEGLFFLVLAVDDIAGDCAHGECAGLRISQMRCGILMGVISECDRGGFVIWTAVINVT